MKFFNSIFFAYLLLAWCFNKHLWISAGTSTSQISAQDACVLVFFTHHKIHLAHPHRDSTFLPMQKNTDGYVMRFTPKHFKYVIFPTTHIVFNSPISLLGSNVFFSCQHVRKGDKPSEMMADMFTGLKTAPPFRTFKRLVLFPLGCIWKVRGAMAVTARPASTETIKNFKVTKKIIIGSPCYKACMRSLYKS